jgi:hypothetical protein
MVSSLKTLMEVAGLYRRRRCTASDEVTDRKSPLSLCAT